MPSSSTKMDDSCSYQQSGEESVGVNPQAEKEQRLPILSIIIALLGNLYEYYDWGLLGYFATEVGMALYPKGSDADYAMEVYALYALGFVFRPFGGAVFGYIGDKFGRKHAIRSAILCMGLCTFLTGCIPTFDRVGWWAPVMLLALRIGQAFSTGGENGSTAIYLYEMAPQHRKGLMMSIVACSGCGGLLGAAMHGILFAASGNNEEWMATWGWRIPFWLGLGLVFLSFYAQSAMQSTDHFQAMEHASTENAEVLENPMSHVWHHNKWQVLKITFASALSHGGGYLIGTFIADFTASKQMHGWSDHYAYVFTTANTLLGLPTAVFIGSQVDRFGADPFIFGGSMAIAVTAPALFYMFTLSTSPWMDFTLQFMLTQLFSVISGSAFYWYTYGVLTDARTRVSVYSIGYNLGAALFSGTAVFLAATFVDVWGSTRGMILAGLWFSTLALITLSTMGVIRCCEKEPAKRVEDSEETAALLNFTWDAGNTGSAGDTGHTRNDTLQSVPDMLNNRVYSNSF